MYRVMDVKTLVMDETDQTRRSVLLAAAAAGAATLTPDFALAAKRRWPRLTRYRGFDQRHLAIRQVGRDEAVHIAFRKRSGRPVRLAINRLSWAFRDWRDGDQGLAIDLRLFDKLAAIQTMLTLVEDRPVELTLHSGYRTPERNRTLEGAAVHSQHIVGRAADVSADGVSHARLAEAAELAGVHGLGRYPIFTHIDVGKPGRRWSRL